MHKDIKRNIDGYSTALVMKEFEFRGKKSKRIYNSSPKDINKTIINNIKWCFQQIEKWTSYFIYLS